MPEINLKVALPAAIALYAICMAPFFFGPRYELPPIPKGRVVEQLFFRVKDGIPTAQTFTFMQGSKASGRYETAELYERHQDMLRKLDRDTWSMTPDRPTEHYRYVFLKPGAEIKDRRYWIVDP